MAKKHTKRKKAIRYYLWVFFLTSFTELGVYLLGINILKRPTLCANTRTCQSDLQEKIESQSTGTFLGQEVNVPPIDLSFDSEQPAVLGESVPEGEKHIYIDLASQKLYAYQGNTKIMETFVSSGRWGRTPVGNFNIWIKLRATRMAGGSGSDAYDLPNVPYVMYFYRDFGLHGAYWHNNFGHTMSHGCVNLREVDAKNLYLWADAPSGGRPGTAVSVCKQFQEPDICQQT